MKIKRIVFMGTPEFAVPSLIELVKNDYKPLLCVTQPDREKGRNKKILPPPVKIEAEKLRIPVFQPENINSDTAIDKILELKPQIIITVAYGEFIGKKLRNLPDFGAINLHPSLLPKYRGPSPINFALFNGEEYTGNTIFKLIARMDAGPILYQNKIKIENNENYTELSLRLAKIGAKDIIKVLNLLENNKIRPIKQNEDEATYTKKIEKNDLLISLNDNAKNIINKIRGLALKPGAYINFKNKKLKLLEAILTKDISTEPPSTITGIIKNKGLKIATKDFDIIITKLQPAGKKIMNAYIFNLGARLKEGDRLIK